MIQEVIECQAGEQPLELFTASDPGGELPAGVRSVRAQLLLDCHCLLGEGVIYDDRKRAVLWTDILARRFHQLVLPDGDNPASKKILHNIYDLPKKLGSFGMLEQESSDSLPPLLCAFEDTFLLYDVERGQVLSGNSQGEDLNPAKGLTRMNDGRVDPSGKRFIAGGYYGEQQGTSMKVFCCEQLPDGSLHHKCIIEPVRVSNSICWSLCGSVMYFADSPTKQIVRYDYDMERGEVSNKKLLHEYSIDEYSVPDGSCVDAEGYLWNAVWRKGAGPGMVQRIDPNSQKVVFTVHMPDTTSQVTCCCFGGKDMNILFITSAAESRDATQEPHAGGLYAVKLPFRGRKESRLNFRIN